MTQIVKQQLGLLRAKWNNLSTSYRMGILATVVAMIAPVVALVAIQKKHSALDNYVTVNYTYSLPRKLAIGEEYPVLSCKIIDGYWFYVLLEDQKWHQVKLTSVTQEKATPVVTELLQGSCSSSVVLKRKLDNSWAVDFFVTTSGENINLLAWLKANNFTF